MLGAVLAGDERLVYGLREHLPAVRAAEAAALLDLFPRRLAGGALGVLALSAFRHALHEAERRLDARGPGEGKVVPDLGKAGADQILSATVARSRS